MGNPGYYLSARPKVETALALKEDQRTPAYFRAMAKYVPPKLNSKIVAINCELERSGMFKSPAAWRSRASAVEHATVPGDHLGCITREAAALAKCMSAFLN
jgi:hypothetical protein